MALRSLAAPPLAALLATAPTAAQSSGLQLHAAIASSEHRGQVPAIAWLCEDYLPTLASWPHGLNPSGTIGIALSSEGLRVFATDVAVPVGCVAIGSIAKQASTAGAGAASQQQGASQQQKNELLFRCQRDGREQWFLPTSWAAPPSPACSHLLATLAADVVGTPRSVSLPVLTGHAAGALLEGDPAATLLRLCPTLCGDVTWQATLADGQLSVCGRSDGGLTLPAVLALLAEANASGSQASPLARRAFTAVDGDASEATRQLGRSDRDLDAETLRALLRARGPEQRLSAIDALIRQNASNELPRIIAASGADRPWATRGASDALQALWTTASVSTRKATRKALAASDSADLRRINLRQLDQRAADSAGSDDGSNAIELARLRARMLLVLLCTGVCVLGLWLRERARLQPIAPHTA
ncbi:MAG: hypothetical protein AB8H80_13775 [Planctomycetota bacterium]